MSHQQTIEDPIRSRTPSPIKSEEPSYQRYRGDGDLEGLVLRMHGKMKSLESRYLDLANFYKRELLQEAP
jgi:hypothetical protein